MSLTQQAGRLEQAEALLRDAIILIGDTSHDPFSCPSCGVARGSRTSEAHMEDCSLVAIERFLEEVD